MWNNLMIQTLPRNIPLLLVNSSSLPRNRTFSSFSSQQPEIRNRTVTIILTIKQETQGTPFLQKQYNSDAFIFLLPHRCGYNLNTTICQINPLRDKCSMQLKLWERSSQHLKFPASCHLRLFNHGCYFIRL